MRRVAGLLLLISSLIGVTSPARAANDLVIGVWPQRYSQFTEIQAASGISFPYFRGRMRDGQFDSNLIGPDAHVAADTGESLGLNIQPKTGTGNKRIGILYTDISAQIQAGSGPYYDKLVSMANEVLALPTYGVVPNYLQFHSEASTQALPGVPAAQPYSGTGPEYQQCYSLIHQLFDSLGVTNQIFWQIVLQRGTYGGDQGGPATWFPSDPSQYDLVGVDAYYRGPQWLSPAESFDPALTFARAQSKPLWIDEVGADEGGPTHSATAKAEWFGSLDTYLEANLGDIAGVVFSNAADGGGNWYLDSVAGGRAVPNYSGISWTGWKMAVTALWAAPPPNRSLSVAVAGSGTGIVTSTPSGIVCPGDCGEGFTQSESVDLTVAADAGSVFTGWSGGCTGIGSVCHLFIDATTSVSATFELEHNLTVTTDGPGTGSVTSDVGGIDCPATSCVASGLAHNTHVVLRATPDPGSAVAGWSGGGCTGTVPTCEVTMDADHVVSATFQAGVDLSVTLAGGGTGRVTSTPGGEISCPSSCTIGFTQSSSVTLQGHADVNSIFTGWSSLDTGFSCPGTGDCTVTMDAAKSVTAQFDLTQPLLTVTTQGNGIGTVTSDVGGINCPGTCAVSYDLGAVVILTARPTGGSIFTGWSGVTCAGTGTCTLTMDASKSVTGTFDPPATTTTLGDDDPAVSYNGWFGVADAQAIGGFLRNSEVKDDTATWTSPPTTSIRWMTRTGPAQGKASVTIDGKNKGTSDLYSAAPAILTKVFSGLANKAHTIVIKVLRTKNAASTGYRVSLDAFVAGTTTKQASDPQIVYDAWKSTRQALATDGTYRSSAAGSATVKVTFTGNSIDWITTRGKAYGKASVKIDGVPRGTVDLYQPATVWRFPLIYGGLSAGTHTIVIQVLGQKNAAATGKDVVVDGFIVRG